MLVMRRSFRLPRVQSFPLRFELVNGRLDGLRHKIDGPFTNAVEVFVGMHLGEEPVFPGISSNESFNVCDTHGSGLRNSCLVNSRIISRLGKDASRRILEKNLGTEDISINRLILFNLLFLYKVMR